MIVRTARDAPWPAGASTARARAGLPLPRSWLSSAFRAAPGSSHGRRRGRWGADRRALSQARFNQIRGKKSRWLRDVSQFVTLTRPLVAARFPAASANRFRTKDTRAEQR